MTGLREQKKIRTRQAIVDAAMKLFAERGFEHTSMDELAREAGVGKGTIYGYFRTKSEIFLAFCEEEIDYAFAALDAKLNAEAPLHEQLLALMLGQLTYVTRNREFGRVFAREMLFPSSMTRPLSRDLDMRYLGKLGEVLARAQGRGELPQQADMLLLIGHLHALYLLTLSAFYQGDLETMEEAEILLGALILQTLEGPAVVIPDEPRCEGWDDLKRKFFMRRNLELS